MSESAPERPGGGGKVLGLKPRTAIIVGGGVLIAAVIYMLWKRKQSATTTASTSASSSTSGIDYGGELSVIQSELEDLMAAEGQESSSGTSSSGTGTTTGTGTGSSGTGTATKTTTPAKTAAPAMPGNVHATKTTANSVTLAWDKAANAATYRVRVTYQGKLVGAPHVVAGTSATISGLGADHTYTFHVASIGPGGTSAETNGPAVKTSR